MAFAFITPIIYIHCLSRINSQWTTIFYDDGTSSVEWEKAGSATITFNTQSEYCQTGNCIYINGANDGYIRRTVDVSEYISLRLQWSYTTTAEQDGGSYCYVYYSYDTKTRIARYTQRFVDPDFWALFGRIYGKIPNVLLFVEYDLK
eukprot:1076671_1